jgi:hypothetical protein
VRKWPKKEWTTVETATFIKSDEKLNLLFETEGELQKDDKMEGDCSEGSEYPGEHLDT